MAPTWSGAYGRRPPGLDRIEALMRPKSIAVIGASAQRVTLGNTVLRNFQRWPFSGPLYVVHPTASLVEGYRTVPAVRDLPHGLDVAMVCVPAPAVADVLRELDAVGCRSAIAVAAGFDPDQDRRLRAVIRELSLAVCGPNNMGVINATDRIALYTARFRDPLPVGGVALVAQSGSGAIALVNTPGLGFSKVITSGNEYSLTAADYLRWLAEDPATTAAGVMVESIADGDDFADAARTFAGAGKRLAVLKVGRTESGALAAQAHTGALLSSWDAYAAFFRREHIAVATDYDELAATLQAFQHADLPHPPGNRLAVIAISGGEGALACDVAAELGLPLSRFTPATQEELARWLPGARPDNPIDFGASVGRSSEAQEHAIRAVLQDPEVDVALVVQDAQGSLPIHDAHDYVQYLHLLRQAVSDAEKPVLVVSTTSANTHPRLEQELAGLPVPLLRGVREAVVACANVAKAAEAVRRASGRKRPEKPPAPTWTPPKPGPQDPETVAEILGRYGIRHVPRAVVADVEAALAAADRLGYPLAVKVVSPDIPHRSDVGGVVLDVADAAALRRAVATVADNVRRHRPDAAVAGFELQPQIRGAVEALVGFKADPTFRGLVTVGLGGVLVELVRQYAVDLVPLDPDGARALIRSTPLGRLLEGYRGYVEPTPVEPLAELVSRLAQLGFELAPAVQEVDLNPVLIVPGSGEVWVVDALVVAAPPVPETA